MPPSILVVGAGPVGLAAAIEFRRLGYPVRLIDRLPHGAKESRAVVVNTKSLRLLEASGATGKLLATGVHLKAMRMVVDGEVKARLVTSHLPKPYDFMLALPQNVTEDILADTLLGMGVAPEREVELVAFTQNDERVAATLRHVSDGHLEETEVDWLVAADGTHSTARHQLGLAFAGNAYPFRWSLADVDLIGDCVADEGEARINPGKPFILRVPIAPGRNRLIANAPDVLSLLPPGWSTGAIHWQSDFTVSHRMVEKRLVGRVALIGDAAHIHSPAGGRGMNLGIEDAASLAAAIHDGRIGAWETQRLARARAVLKESDMMQRVVTMGGGIVNRALLFIVSKFLAIPFVQSQLLRRVAAADE